MFFIMKSVWSVLIKKSKSDIYRKEAFTVAFYLNSETGFMSIVGRPQLQLDKLYLLAMRGKELEVFAESSHPLKSDFMSSCLLAGGSEQWMLERTYTRGYLYPQL